MDSKKNAAKSEDDFSSLDELCMSIVNEDKYQHNTVRDWTQEEIDLFVSQFQHTLEEDEDPLLDMEKLDPKFYPRSYFREKFPGFDDTTIDILYECENKKLEDARLPPLRSKHGEFNAFANDDQNKSLQNTNGEEDESETGCDSNSANCASV